MKRANLFIASMALLALIVQSPAHAEDSTKGAYFQDDNGQAVSAKTPTYVSAGYFDIEQGVSDPYLGDAKPYGYMETLYCQDETSSTEAFCLVRALTYRAYNTNYDTSTADPEICPKDFVPVFTANPQTSDDSIGKSFVCPAPAGGFGSYTIGPSERATPKYASGYSQRGHFWLYMLVSAKLKDNGTSGSQELVPSVSVYWKISCFPTKSKLIQITNPSSDKCHIKSGESLPPTLLDSGVSEKTTNSNNKETITTSKICPKNYTPYAEIQMSAPDTSTNSSSDFQVLNSYSYCLSRIKEAGGGSPTHYDLTVLFSSTTTEIEKSGGGLTVHDPQQDAGNKFLNIQWTVYCYPPGSNPPWDFVANPGGPGSSGKRCLDTDQPYAP